MRETVKFQGKLRGYGEEIPCSETALKITYPDGKETYTNFVVEHAWKTDPVEGSRYMLSALEQHLPVTYRRGNWYPDTNR